MLANKIELNCKQLSPTLKKNEILNLDLDIKTIEGFISMESDQLSPGEIKRILRNNSERLEALDVKAVKNILHIIEYFNKWDPLSITDFKHAHKILMSGMDSTRGIWRTEEVVVLEGRKITHVPPAAKNVPLLMKQLFHDLRKNNDLSYVIKSCILHYGIQYIHPFADGNGRMGRIWQHLFLIHQDPVFKYVLVGRLIKRNSVAYYRSLDKSDKAHDGAFFVEFCLRKILNLLYSFQR